MAPTWLFDTVQLGFVSVAALAGVVENTKKLAAIAPTSSSAQRLVPTRALLSERFTFFVLRSRNASGHSAHQLASYRLLHHET